MDFESLLSLLAVLVAVWILFKLKKKNNGVSRRDDHNRDDDYYDNDDRDDDSGDYDSGGDDSSGDD
jgi:hypothetical protein